ncbi:hypothetical protein RB195_008912 [Necator americanus]|uniref:UBX domain-containing protein 4 n=1 Tax=Necator americanus TaxID=51031 RepID=A0ABR1CS42_NECAM
MKWFEGSVSTAIQVSRRNNALFVVFIESKNGKGEKMRELWDKIEPSLFDCPFVGIHLMEGDEAAEQFAQIYPTPVLPASYVIDSLGKPIEIITFLKDLDYDEFFCKLNNAAKAFVASRKSVNNVSSSQNSGDVQRHEAPSTSAQASSSNTIDHGLSLQEKVERAKKLLEQKKKADEEAKKLEEKERELERINSGKLMQEAQKRREEQELIEAAAQRRRDKIEAEKERERVKAQIKADREEREFRERRGKPIDLAPAGDMPAELPKMEPVPSDRCRVQVRLPSGENIVEEFPSSDCLNTLIELIEQDGRVSGPFSIAQVYPRKVFSEEELQMSFLDLCLTPTCTLLVLQSRQKTAQIIAASPLGGILSLFSIIFIAPLQYFWNVIAGYLGWNSGSNTRSANQSQQSEAKRQREPHSTGATVRRRGNVTRLHNTNDDSDDENANWNGNSTQFL